ncbi:hypothetical protein GQ53DRAFT_755411 [Thozetella sp. PMI_491]|nr:hypothetical protein GQ53DRAFT_755411 [Thozetella sp. PMI_491]
MIWELCLPRRLVDINPPLTANDVFDNSLADHCFRNSRPPLITRVCAESRRVAFRNGGMQPGEIHWLDARPSERRLLRALSNYWITYATDRVLLNSTRLPHIDNATILPHLQFLHYLLGRHRSICIPYTSLSATELKDSELLASWRTVRIVAPHRMAVRSGLFGLTGEELLQLVDPLDRKRLEQFQSFFSQCASEKHPDTLEFFTQALGPEGTLHEALAAQRSIEENFWVYLHWHLTTSSPPTESWRHSGTGALIQDHPFVVEALGHMPKRRTMILFRLCPEEQYLGPQPQAT